MCVCVTVHFIAFPRFEFPVVKWVRPHRSKTAISSLGESFHAWISYQSLQNSKNLELAPTPCVPVSTCSFGEFMPVGFCHVCSYMFLPYTSIVHIQDLHIRQLPSRWPEKKLGPCGTLRSSETNESPSRGEWHKKEKMGEVEVWQKTVSLHDQQGMQSIKNLQVSSEITRKHESSDRTVHVRLLRVWLVCCFVDLGQAVRVQRTWHTILLGHVCMALRELQWLHAGLRMHAFHYATHQMNMNTFSQVLLWDNQNLHNITEWSQRITPHWAQDSSLGSLLCCSVMSSFIIFIVSHDFLWTTLFETGRKHGTSSQFWNGNGWAAPSRRRGRWAGKGQGWWCGV